MLLVSLYSERAKQHIQRIPKPLLPPPTAPLLIKQDIMSLNMSILTKSTQHSLNDMTILFSVKATQLFLICSYYVEITLDSTDKSFKWLYNKILK